MFAAVVQALGAAGQIASGVLSAQARQAEFAEGIRQLKVKKEYTVGLATMKAAASGFDLRSASTVSYLRGLTREYDIALKNLRNVKGTTQIADMLGVMSGGAQGAAQSYGAYRQYRGT
jgi:hypothetical protein